jgi:hypothetical protein
MKKQVKALIELGSIYLACSIVLDYFLSGYPALLWPALAVAFFIFGGMIFSVLWQNTPQAPRGTDLSFNHEDDLTQFEYLCDLAINQGDRNAGEAVSERIRSLAFAAAAYHLSVPETMLRTMIEQEPRSLDTKIGDQPILFALTTRGSLIRRGEPQTLQNCMKTIEDWTN